MKVKCKKTIPVYGTDKVYFMEGHDYEVIRDERPDFFELKDETGESHIVTNVPHSGLIQYFDVIKPETS